MDIKFLTTGLSVSEQVMSADLKAIQHAGFRAIFCNRPDGEGAEQPTFAEIEKAARQVGIDAIYLPVASGKVADEDVAAFEPALADLPGPVLAYCRTGTRSTTLWSLGQANKRSLADILATSKAAGYDMGRVVHRIVNGGKTPTDTGDASYAVVIVGAGAGCIAAAASLKARKPDLEIAIIDPADIHYYQLGRTMVGGGILIQFNNAGGVLFGIKDYVLALIEDVKKYDVHLNFFHNLVAVDGTAKKAWFDVAKPDTAVERIEMDFDIMDVCPPQTAPDFIRMSPLADAAGWIDIDQATLRHSTYDNIWSLGDVMNAPNAKTMAAARIQAPIVAENTIADMRGGNPVAQCSGYGSCPLTVERGKIVLAEFGYGGALLPSFPKAVIDGTRPTRTAWFLKEKILPPIYWKGLLKGREWMAKPEKIAAE